MKGTTYEQKSQTVTGDVLQAIQRQRVLMFQQNKTLKNDISTIEFCTDRKFTS